MSLPLPPALEHLARFLLDRSEVLLERWRAAVRQDPASPANRMGLEGAALDDHVPSLIRMLAECLLGVTPVLVAKEGAEHGRQRRQHGYAVTELLREMTLFRRVLMEAVEQEFQQSPQRLEPTSLAQARLTLLDLLDRSVHASVSRYMEEAEGERDEARAQMADATARLEQANAQLREVQAQKDRFFSMLSHELRNPLGPILNAVQVLARLGAGVPALEAPRAIIERQTRHLVRLVDDLLDVNRIAYGKLEVRRVPVPLQQAVRFAVESTAPAFTQKGVRLALELPEEPVAVHGDETRLAQAVMNLLANAVKFTPSGGAVTVALHAEAQQAVLRVTDTGVGIAPDLLPRIFDPFEQAEDAAARRHGGLGLGLMIAKGLVEAHGGRIEAESAGAGRGATFLVRLPQATAAPEVAPAPARSQGAVPAPPRRIVLIEDNLDARDALAAALRLLGHEVHLGASAEAAHALVAAMAPDVVVLDIGLPGTSGYDLAAALRTQPRSRHALLVALAGYDQPVDGARARAAGFDHYLTKPVDVDALAALIAAGR